jgi:putative N6-adenine-specific DNA methylase
MKSFFVSCPINFETELIKEIQGFWHLMMDLDGLPTREGLPDFEIDKGGVLFECSLHLGLQINLFSHIANRVLLRHITFKARYFDQFEKDFKKIDFSKIFIFNSKTSNDKQISIEIESSKSRLFHEKNLTETITKILHEKKIQLVPNSENRLFIRLFNDIVTISIDTTGEHLHFRGYRKHQGVAPIRENLAYLTLQIAGLMNAHQKTILDPFCGSGTILFESVLNGIPHGFSKLSRSFPFFNLPMTPALFQSPTWAKNYKWLKPVANKLIGLDKDLETLNKAVQNQKVFSEIYFEPQISLSHVDSSQCDLKTLGISQDEKLWIVTNPPYGERLSSEQIPAILKRFESLEMLQGVIVLHPSDWQFQFKRLKQSLSIPFSNQGLKLSLSVFKPS